jgi:two-component system CitB family sensor kinase
MGRVTGRRLSSQIFAFQALILLVTLGFGFFLALHAARHRLDQEEERRALAVAQSVAATPEIVGAVARGDRTGTVQRRAEQVRRATGTAFVVVADRHGIRYSHPDPELIGKRVHDAGPVLAGHTVLTIEHGALGRSARGKVPLRARDGRIVGEVSVGVLDTTIRQELGTAIPIIGLYTAIALGTGLLASFLLAARLKRQTFGLELGEIADLLQEHEATLRGIREGVIAADPHGRLRVVNDEARRLLGLPDDPVGRRIDELPGLGTAAELLAGRRSPATDVVFLHEDRILVANAVPVRLHGRDLGAVVTLRDRTELEALVRELDSVRDLTDAMRAQAHEFSNRLHTLSGLLQLEHYAEAISFIREISHADTVLKQAVTERLADPLVGALVLAKSAVAAERGVELRLTEDTLLVEELADPRAVLTVVGNLIDNGLDAARDGDAAEPPWVEVALHQDDDGTLVVRVADSGPGVAPGMDERIFDPGFSTKPPSGGGSRGVGLSLVRQLAERRGGAVRVRAGGGTVFEARLPGAARPATREGLPS